MKNELKKSSNNDLKMIAETIEEAGTCMLTTVDHNGGLASRPMNVLELDHDGSLWFFVLSDSNLMNEVRKIPVVNLTFTCGKSKFISALAIAYESFDRDKIKELWNSSMEKLFNGGVNDNNLTLLKLDLQEVEYWGSPHSVAFKIMDFVRVITGDRAASPIVYEKVDFNQII